MGNIKRVVERLLLLACMGLAGYMVFLQFQYFLHNHDLSSISHRKFNSDAQDKYPIFTICYIGTRGGYIFSQSSPLFNYGKDRHLYNRFLRGKLNPKYEQDVIENFTRINYDEVIDDIFKDIPTLLVTKSNKNKRLTSWGKFSSNPIPLVLSHQSHTMLCYSKKLHNIRNVTLKYDMLRLNAKKLQQSRVSLYIYLHQEGQLIRNSAQPLFKITSAYLKELSKEYNTGFSHEIKFSISGVDVLRRRRNANIPCNATLYDEDKKWRDSIMSNVRCIPQFWSRFVLNSTLEQNLKDCGQEQYRKINEQYISNFNFEHGSKLYTGPCNQMTTSLSRNVKTLRGIGLRFGLDIKIQFFYITDWYKEILNYEAYTVETLLSQVGGFVGIFLGFSMLQVAQSIITMMLTVRKYFKGRRMTIIQGHAQSHEYQRRNDAWTTADQNMSTSHGLTNVSTIACRNSQEEIQSTEGKEANWMTRNMLDLQEAVSKIASIQRNDGKLIREFSSISSIQKSDISLVKHSISALEDNMSGKFFKVKKDQNDMTQNISDMRQDISEIQIGISKIQRGLTFIYGKKQFEK